MVKKSVSLQVTTLGRFSILRNQDLLSGGFWNRRRVRELFKILLSAEQHRLHREQVQELLWPSSSLEQAANSFGKTLYLLRRARTRSNDEKIFCLRCSRTGYPFPGPRKHGDRCRSF